MRSASCCTSILIGGSGPRLRSVGITFGSFVRGVGRGLR